MKKKILIVSDSLNMGGLEKCLINLCDNLDYDKYEVDLYLFNEGRTLLNKLNKNINLLADSPYYKDVYNLSVGKSIITLLKKKKFSLAFYRFIRFIRIRFKDKKYRNIDWKMMQKTMLSIDKKYDIAVGFAEGTSCYYVANCVNADVKIGWIHTDLKKTRHNYKLDAQSFNYFSHIATVSQNSLNSLIELFPTFKEKFVCIKLPGLMDYQKINELAKKSNLMDEDKENIKILSVGRLVELKGFHLCVEPCRRLIDEGFKIKWYIAGEGDYHPYLQDLISQYKLEDNFILLGNCGNPYRYMRSADICVQPSSYEGFSLAVYEEKYFNKPVVATKIPSNYEMISDGENGLLVDRTSDAIYDAVKSLLIDHKKREEIGKTPLVEVLNNKVIMEKVESLFFK